MTIELVEAPEVEPVSVEQARAYLRLTSASEDEFIGGLVKAARLRVEETTGYALAPQTRRLVLDAWPDGPLELPAPPLLEVEEVEYVAPDGTVTQLAEGFDYDVATESTPGAIVPRGYAAGLPWPSAARRPDAVRVTFRCGYGEPGSAELPENLDLAIKAIALHWFDHRGTTIAGTIATPLPQTYDFMTASHRFRYRRP